MSEVTNLNDERILRAVEDQTDLTRENSNIVEALEEAKERSNMYQAWEDAQANKLIKEGKEPYPCLNAVCGHYVQVEDEHVADNGEVKYSGRFNYCGEGMSHGCMFQMNSHPPNSLNYDEYMPTHVEALDMLEKNGLLKGSRKEYEEANVYYNKANTDDRHSTEIKGINFKHIYAIMEYIYKEMPYFFNPESNGTALCQNICMEIEKAMGIYPNIRLR